MNSNGNRDYSAMTAYKDPASKLFSLYEQPAVLTAGVTLVPVKGSDGKQLRVDAEFVRKHGISERTEA